MDASSVPKQLAQPLSATVALSKHGAVADAAKLLRSPPRTMGTPLKPQLTPAVPVAPPPHRELEEEFAEAESPSVARAIFAQSAALTQLVSHLTSAASDPMVDLSTSGTSSSTKGAMGRAKLQAELATHRRTFFDSVMRSMARRMSPTTASSELSADQLLAMGISGVKYLERFGGYGRHRDFGLLQFQMMTVFDFLMASNLGAAKDTLALTIVMLEQAVLDNGRFEVASLLGLMEDPPASIYTNRSSLATSRARAFAPLADQRWVTTALAYLKELGAIPTKRVEFASGPPGSSSSTTASGDPASKAKSRPKKKGRGKGPFQNMDAEEEN